ncbi:MAG: hypothetical protein CME25_01830 [Gemmatimonadetes bacterium]|nr:hypothetical protein [Gemmatimonadota bacterium]
MRKTGQGRILIPAEGRTRGDRGGTGPGQIAEPDDLRRGECFPASELVAALRSEAEGCYWFQRNSRFQKGRLRRGYL